MRAHRWILSAALGICLSSTAIAQTVPSPNPGPPPTPPLGPPNAFVGSVRSHWMASGFAGTNFDIDGANKSPDFGGQVAYLWHGLLGGELLGNVTPSFKLNNLLVSGTPNINTLMTNAIAAIPLGTDGRVQPYISGGLGAMQMRSDVFSVDIGTTAATALHTNQSTLGSNLGGGVMAFAGNVGIRGDIRFFHAFDSSGFSSDASTPEDIFARSLLQGLDIWRANLGIAVRW